ncbi:MAG: ankyrin repeat domain-containing protein, partial [Silvanigrellaceae bacterium]|nr:ankyrin repeat domain-containing protein [Silvanigrellaceae bacterium]
MPSFTELFFQPISQELTDQEKIQLMERLQAIYQNEVTEFTGMENFDRCKAQLMTLLEHIYYLNPATLNLFARYRNKVNDLSKYCPYLEIQITLQSAKRSIEKSLLSIEKNYLKVDGTKLNNLIVELCYFGANTNIDYALGYFQLDSLSFFVEVVKEQLLQELVQQFLLAQNIVKYVGNESHYVNSLYNYFAEDYGLSVREEPLAKKYPTEMLSAFTEILKNKFTVSAFLQLLIMSAIQPPDKDITDDNFNELNDFFYLFEQKGCVEEKYLRLYDEKWINDLSRVLSPKPNIALYSTYVLASYLEEKGYIAGLRFQALGKSYVTNGSMSVQDDGEYHLLSEEELLALAKEPLEERLCFSLLQQLTAETLLDHFLKESAEEDRGRFYSVLLSKPQLSKEMIVILYNKLVDCDEDNLVKKSQLANYIFNNDYSLSSNQLCFLAMVLSKETKATYLKMAIQRDQADYAESILRSNAEFLHKVRPSLGFTLAKAGACSTLNQLLNHKIMALSDLKVVDKKGATTGHFAAFHGRLDFLRKLWSLGIALNKKDNRGWTIAHCAASKGYENIIQKCDRLGVYLDRVD